jgi:hypothetical protein
LGNTSGGALIGPATATTGNTVYTTLSGSVIPSTVQGIVFSWTTGTVSVTAVHGPFPTVFARHGFDNRIGTGWGVIQLVTPMLTRWTGPSRNYETASIGVMRLHIPEPHAWLMLAAGLSMLALLSRSNRRPH